MVVPLDSVGGSQWQDVAWTGSMFVAVGGGPTGAATLATSTDGRTWKVATAGGASASVRRIAAGPNGIVAIGWLDDQTASWRSTDGIHWNYRLKVFPTSLSGEDQVSVTDVVATPTGWLAFGRDDAACRLSCVPQPLRALIWTSSDGLSWTRVTGQSALRNGGINTAVAFRGGFVAAGDAGGRAAFWSSPDGATWTRAADEPSFGPAQPGALAVSVEGLAELNGTIVAVGHEPHGEESLAPAVRAWRSTDGGTWTPGSVADAVDGQVFQATATTTRFLAVGPSGGRGCLGGIWSSPDGTAWSCEASDPAFQGFGPYAAAASATVEVAVGLTDFGCIDGGCPNGSPGAIWWRPAG